MSESTELRQAMLQQAKAEAWDEGCATAIDEYGTDVPWGGSTSEDNPYRAPAKETTP